MLISEMIDRLEKMKNRYGDIHVKPVGKYLVTKKNGEAQLNVAYTFVEVRPPVSRKE